MAKNTSMAIGDHFEAFIKKQIKTGRYSSASEVVRAGLRLLEREERQLRAVQKALVAGEESGQADPIDGITFKKRMRQKYVKDNA